MANPPRPAIANQLRPACALAATRVAREILRTKSAADFFGYTIDSNENLFEYRARAALKPYRYECQ